MSGWREILRSVPGRHITTAQVDGIAVVQLNRPPVNALDTELNDAITSTFAGIDGPIVLTGSDRCFCAGVDLRAILDGGADYTVGFLDSLVSAFLAVFDHPAPVVAAVNGHALAGGCVIAMAADVRIMSGGTIGLTEIAVGVPFPVSAIEICRHVMGASAAAAALGGAPVPAEEALRLGWVDAVVAPGELVEHAAARARGLGAPPAEAYALTKEQLHRPVHDAIARGAEDARRVVASWSSEQTRTSIARFLASLRR